MSAFTTQRVVIEFPERTPDWPEAKAFSIFSPQKSGLPRCKNLWTFSLFRTFCFCRFYCADFFVSFVLRHPWVQQVLTPRMSPKISSQYQWRGEEMKNLSGLLRSWCSHAEWVRCSLIRERLTAQSNLSCFTLCRKTTPKTQRAAKQCKMAIKLSLSWNLKPKTKLNWAGEKLSHGYKEKETTNPSLCKWNLFYICAYISTF